MIDRRGFVGQIGGAGIAGMPSSLSSWKDLAGRGTNTNTINVDDHGASVDGRPEKNLSAFRGAIEATPVGGTLLVPYHGDRPYSVDTSGGLLHALSIDRRLTVVLRGWLRASHGVSGPNPPYIFDVKATDVAIVGDGRISGPGYVDDVNLVDDQTHAGLIRVTGDRFRLIGPTVSDVPKIGVHLWNCRGATISATWRGGIERYIRGNTGLFGIRATGGGQHRIVSNRFERDGQGRRLITGYFAGGLMGPTTADEIRDNIADVHEKLAYLHTYRSVVRNCIVTKAMETDAIRIKGSGNLVDNVKIVECLGGITIYNGSDNIVKDCNIISVYQSGIVVSFVGKYDLGFTGTIVSGNAVSGGANADALQDGVCLYIASKDTLGIAVMRNRIDAHAGTFWRNGIRVESVPPYHATGITVCDNILNGAVNGLNLRRLKSAVVSGNRVSRLRGGEAMLEITS